MIEEKRIYSPCPKCKKANYQYSELVSDGNTQWIFTVVCASCGNKYEFRVMYDVTDALKQVDINKLLDGFDLGKLMDRVQKEITSKESDELMKKVRKA